MRWLFFVFGLAAIGWVGFAIVDAKIFQVREAQQFSAMEKHIAASAHAPAAESQLTNASLELTAGATLGRIEIARIGVDAIVVEGTGSKWLRRAVGHISGTALPGSKGNVAIAGHRDTFFRALRDIHADDAITLTTLSGVFRYRVDSATVVDPGDTSVLTSGTQSTLTLITCYPFYFVGPAPERFVVRARLEP
ncbi:MAG TPA: class D sortase [Terriglobales bacterium]|nr:class D sortase [Terriglobales bacterium]